MTQSPALRHLGLDPDDANWERIGYDWVRPADPEAWERLSVRPWSAARRPAPFGPTP